MDQGATQAIPIFRVSNRLTSGLVEVIFKNHVADKTSWQKMLKGEANKLDMSNRRDALYTLCETEITELSSSLEPGTISFLHDEATINIEYPINEYPLKVKSYNFDKTLKSVVYYTALKASI